ncbi:MAG TPA: AMP-binding protein, partial [Deltaproteobacteria bacterium]|nr:AMP-binding protein [Deltaproteobacteria bacterium]
MSSKTHLNQAIASHLVEMKVDSVPDKEIFIFERGAHGEDILTYQKLHDNSNKIARMLLDNGIGEGDTFAVFMRN